MFMTEFTLTSGRFYRGAMLFALKPDPIQPVVIIRKKQLCYIFFRTGILLINAAGVTISWGILSCPPVSGGIV